MPGTFPADGQVALSPRPVAMPAPGGAPAGGAPAPTPTEPAPSGDGQGGDPGMLSLSPRPVGQPVEPPADGQPETPPTEPVAAQSEGDAPETSPTDGQLPDGQPEAPVFDVEAHLESLRAAMPGVQIERVEDVAMIVQQVQQHLGAQLEGVQWLETFAQQIPEITQLAELMRGGMDRDTAIYQVFQGIATLDPDTMEPQEYYQRRSAIEQAQATQRAQAQEQQRAAQAVQQHQQAIERGFTAFVGSLPQDADVEGFTDFVRSLYRPDSASPGYVPPSLFRSLYSAFSGQAQTQQQSGALANLAAATAAAKNGTLSAPAGGAPKPLPPSDPARASGGMAPVPDLTPEQKRNQAFSDAIAGAFPHTQF